MFQRQTWSQQKGALQVGLHGGMQLYGVGVAQMDADFPDLPLDGQTDRLRAMRGLSSVSHRLTDGERRRTYP